MNRTIVGRYDPCPCKSGRKFKKCCLAERAGVARQPPISRRGESRSEPNLASSVFVEFPESGTERPPSADTTPVLPVEVGLRYTYPEPFGLAEVSYILPAGRLYQLGSGLEIVNDELKPGMQIVLQDGAVATVLDVKLLYEPPDAPVRRSDGLYASRVVGTIRHVGPLTVEVTWPGFTATSSPNHPYYSVTRQGYVPADELQVGEFLLNDENQVVPVQAVGKTKLEMTDLYNVEVEHFHNYYVGKPGGGAVLVHNGADRATGYIDKPAGLGKATKSPKGRVPTKFDDTAKLFPFEASKTIDLARKEVGMTPRDDPLSAYFVYILKDKSTGQILKVGEVQGGYGIYSRFAMYRRKSLETGHRIEAEYWKVGTKFEAHAIERQVGDSLKKQGERLPWDVKANERAGQKASDIGLPWERKPFTVEMNLNGPGPAVIEVK
jgi:hypothetical protein